MNKKIISVIITVLVIVLGLFWYAQSNKSENIVGGSKDSHGCFVAGGFQYSQLKDNCVQVFTEGVRLNPAKEGLDKTLSAFVVYKSEEGVGDAEVFIPGVPDSVVLAKLPDNGAGLWGNDVYKLSQWKGMYTLENKSAETLYQGSK